MKRNTVTNVDSVCKLVNGLKFDFKKVTPNQNEILNCNVGYMCTQESGLNKAFLLQKFHSPFECFEVVESCMYLVVAMMAFQTNNQCFNMVHMKVSQRIILWHFLGILLKVYLSPLL